MAVFDLLYYEAEERMIPGIPGAFRADPAKMLAAQKTPAPEGVEVVLYCSSRNEFVSARVAQALGARGVPEGWVLEGRPVTLDMPTGEQVAARGALYCRRIRADVRL